MLSSRAKVVLTWLAQLVAALILVMAGISKVTGAPESMVLFTLLGVEPWGRLALGTVELATAALILWPRTAYFGGMLGATLMTGAIGTHLFKIGITYGGGPSLFIMASVVLLASVATILLRRQP